MPQADPLPEKVRGLGTHRSQPADKTGLIRSLTPILATNNPDYDRNRGLTPGGKR